MFNDEIKKYKKKWLMSIWDNMSNSILGLLDWYNSIESKLKKINDVQFSTIQMYKDGIEKKIN
jgi:hypothetical protein